MQRPINFGSARIFLFIFSFSAFPGEFLIKTVKVYLIIKYLIYKTHPRVKYLKKKLIYVFQNRFLLKFSLTVIYCDYKHIVKHCI